MKIEAQYRRLLRAWGRRTGVPRPGRAAFLVVIFLSADWIGTHLPKWRADAS